MPDITDKLMSMLDSEDGLDNLKELAASLLSQSGSKESGKSESSNADGGLGLDMTMLKKLGSALSSGASEDAKEKLLRALKPFLGSEKQEKVEKVIRMTKMLNLVKMMNENGVSLF